MAIDPVPDPSSGKAQRRGQVLGVVAVALLVCLVLVALVWGISGDFLIDESEPVITITQSVP